MSIHSTFAIVVALVIVAIVLSNAESNSNSKTLNNRTGSIRVVGLESAGATANNSNNKNKKRNEPENIHLSLTGNGTQMVVGWKTAQNASSTVRFGTQSGSYPQQAVGPAASSYSSGSGFNHFVVLTALLPATTYYYVVGDPTQAMSDQYMFVTPASSFSSFNMAVYGDLGTDNSQNTINRLNARSANNLVDLFWHLGDIRYCFTTHTYTHTHTHSLSLSFSLVLVPQTVSCDCNSSDSSACVQLCQ
jgi:hypothetical protein